ncbi:MAG TPA: T4 RnlA family RNA ligase [Ktedonobacteraceae bacterium]|nr:T4 RnlA family RNA ligase [Ktedonobacteraceae bacterium]
MDLVIYNYTVKTQFERYWTPETLMCRGLIMTSSGMVVSRPFSKFFNVDEYQASLPLEPFTVTMKMDGSLGVLYFIGNIPYIATRGSFTSKQAEQANRLLRCYQDFPFQKEYTYLFEIIYPDNRIVVDYGDREDLVLLAVIHTETGKEIDIQAASWPFPIVRQYNGIADIAQLRQITEENAEGFVIRFESGLRLKLKFTEYVRLHRIMTQVNAKVIWERLRFNLPLEDLLSRVPDEFYAWIKSTRDSLLTQFKTIEEEGKKVYEQVKNLPTRKEQAAIVKQTSNPAIVFSMLDGKDYADVIWKQLCPQAERPFRDDIDA